MPNKFQMSEELITSCEGRKLVAYLDSRKIPTIGIGITKYPSGKPVCLGETCTPSQANQWLKYHLTTYVYPVLNRMSMVKQMPDAVYAALASFIYNEGPNNIGDSIISALQKLDWNALAEGFRLYNKIRDSDGNLVFCQGLANRREMEIKYFLGE